MCKAPDRRKPLQGSVLEGRISSRKRRAPTTLDVLTALYCTIRDRRGAKEHVIQPKQSPPWRTRKEANSPLFIPKSKADHRIAVEPQEERGNGGRLGGPPAGAEALREHTAVFHADGRMAPLTWLFPGSLFACFPRHCPAGRVSSPMWH
jgi:hypothetical protein